MKKLLCILLIIAVCVPPVSGAALLTRAAAAREPDALYSAAAGIVAYKKAEMGISPEAPLFSGAFLGGAGSTAGDWYPLGMAAFGMADDYEAYLSALRADVRARYETAEKLSAGKATEWHRIALAAMACGADPTRFCQTAEGAAVDLVGDGVFLRKNVGRQGVNGYIWALVALNAGNFAAPGNALNTRESLASELLSRQLPDGGWALSGSVSDTDVTAMALFALAPLAKTGGAAAQAAGRAVALLSARQEENGGYSLGGIANCESCAVVLTALCCLGIDPETDARFLKNGASAVDALFSYRLPDGSFTHSYESDPEDPSAVPNEPNDLSCQQALYALGALYRLRAGGPSVFDFTSASLSDAGWDAAPAAPNAAEEAAENVKRGLAAFFGDESRRKTAVTAALAVVVALAAVALVLRAKKRKRE